MAIENKRMQQRYGSYEAFQSDKDNLLPNEFASVTSNDPNTSDGKALYFAFAPGQTKRLMTAEDAQAEIAKAAEQATQAATEAAQSAQDSAEQAQGYYEQIPAKVEESKQEIEDYTEAIKATIPNDYTALSELVNEIDRERAPGIVCTTSGEQISLTDASDLKFQGLKVFGKSEQTKTTGAQLIDSSLLNLPKTQNGVTATLMDDGGIKLEGSTGDGQYAVFNKSIPKDEYPIQFKAGNITAYMSDTNDGCRVLMCLGTGTSGSEISNVYSNTPNTIGTLEYLGEDYSYINIGVQVDPNTTVNKVFYPMVNYGSSTVPFEKFTGGQPSPSVEYPQEIHVSGEDGSIGINVYGGNLLNPDLYEITNYGGGITYQKGEDGKVIANGTATSNPPCYLGEYVNILKNGETYVVNNETTIQFIKNGKKNYSKKITMSDDITSVKPYIQVTQGTTVVNKVFEPMFNKGETALPWEPPKPIQTLPITCPNGLPGIPVGSGGNYTDKNGQQWISDVRDYVTGKYTQYVKKEYISGTPKFIETGDVPGGFLWSGSFDILFASGISKSISNFSEWAKWGIQYDNENIFAVNGTGLYYSPPETMTAEQVNELFTQMIASDNPPYVIAQLATPIVTDIPAEEMAAYNAMHSNYPTTTIQSDDPVPPGIELDYVADTKTYIDNKIASAVTQAITIAKV